MWSQTDNRHGTAALPSSIVASRTRRVVMRLSLNLCCGFLVLFAVSATPCPAVDLSDQAGDFLSNHCSGCHDADHETGVDLTSFSFELSDHGQFERSVSIYDRVAAGEMPPPDDAELSEADRAAFVEMLSNALREVDSQRIATEGRATQRRLNRYEYENSIRDILNLPWLQIKDQLPEDGEKYRYNKVGEALDVSHVQIARYMSAVSDALKEAMLVKLKTQPATRKRFYARDEPSLVRNFQPREGSTLTDRKAFPVLDSKAQPLVRSGDDPVSSPETREREAVGRVTSIFSDAGGWRWSQFRAPVGGRYRIRLKGYTIWVSGGGIARWFYEGFGDEKAPVYHTILWHRPDLDEVWPGRRHEPIGIYASSSGQSRPLGAFDFQVEPTVGELEVTLRAGEVIQSDGQRLFRTRVNGSDEQYVNPLAQPDGMPGYAVQWLEVEGPLPDQRRFQGYELMFGDLPISEADDGCVELPLPAEPRRGFGFSTEPQSIRVNVQSSDPHGDAARLLRQFISRVYRSGFDESHYERFVDLFESEFEKSGQFASSLLSAYTAVLASPGFLFIQEEPGLLDDHALASRLSFMLWNSEPDEELRTLAASGSLSDPTVLQDQTERLLNDERSNRFVTAFTEYWLDLRKIDDTSPSTTLYNDYELDDPLKIAAIDETQMFVKVLIDENLPARNIVDSDFTFLNERLAQHYGMEDVQGAKMRRVRLREDSVRGGLMTQASVLKVTANGTTTSPVLRGVWISERILGVVIPPPPPVAAVEPDIRGAVTIRQQLELHRADPSCASCHRRMDPPGLALESFDIMGGWRNRYRAVSDEVDAESGIGMNGQAFAFHYALPVDPSGELPDGRGFSGVRGLKQMLLEDERQIARNLVRQLTIFATGAPISFADRQQIEQILDATHNGGYGVRSMIHQLVQSDLFRHR